MCLRESVDNGHVVQPIVSDAERISCWSVTVCLCVSFLLFVRFILVLM